MKSPQLSIIVANYNGENFLDRCLKSILAQSFNDFEIVIYDDCSCDNSRYILNKFNSENPGTFHIIYGSENRGVAEARHEAILSSSGEYITTLDNDDFLMNRRKLEKEMTVIHRHKGSQEVIAFSNIIMVDARGRKIKPQWPKKSIKEGNLFASILSRSSMIPRDFTMKKTFYFEAGGYDFTFPIYEDWDLKIRLARHHPFAYTGINGIAYRQHGSGLSSVPMKDHIEWIKRVYRKNLPLAGAAEIDGIESQFQAYIDNLTGNNG